MLNTPDAPSAGDEVAAEHPDRAIAALDHVVTRLLNHPMVSAETFDQGGGEALPVRAFLDGVTGPATTTVQPMDF